MIDEDNERLRAMSRAFPEIHFFRHIGNRKGVRGGTQFATDYPREWWNRACGNLGNTGVDLYGATRHTTVIAFGKFLTPEELEQASLDATNKAFERQFRARSDAWRNLCPTPQTREIALSNADVENTT